MDSSRRRPPPFGFLPTLVSRHSFLIFPCIMYRIDLDVVFNIDIVKVRDAFF